MKISDILVKKVSLSFEIFPPKTALETDAVLSVCNELEDLAPDFVSVTYGAGGGGSQNSVNVAAHIQRRVPALAHVTCVTATPEKIGSVLSGLTENGVENILALRGDPPADSTQPLYKHYKYAGDLVRDLKSRADLCVGGACYPDGHPECETRERDIENLRHKAECGCDFFVTQLFFNNDVFYNFLYRLGAKGVFLPVIAGIMPITNARQIKKMTTMCGAALTPKHRAIIERWQDDPVSLSQAGIAFACEQIADLCANGVRGVHLYTMNKPSVARAIVAPLSRILR